MNILVEQRRNLSSANCSKELQLSFNMPPLRILMEKIIPEIAKDLRETHYFSRKLEQTKSSMLKYQYLSASLGNFRKKWKKKPTFMLISFNRNIAQEYQKKMEEKKTTFLLISFNRNKEIFLRFLFFVLTFKLRVVEKRHDPSWQGRKSSLPSLSPSIFSLPFPQ